MIRFYTSLCKALLEKFTDVAIFMEATDRFRHYNEKCPRCGAAGKLSPYGDYSRNLVSYKDGMLIESRISPRRFVCASCGVTHALLPDILIPYSPYSLRFKFAILTAYFKKDTNVTVICECFGIAVSTLYDWKKRLLEHKELLLGVLVSRKDSALAFIQDMFGSNYLSDHLCNFFHRYAFSFMQHPSRTATRSPPS